MSTTKLVGLTPEDARKYAEEGYCGPFWLPDDVVETLPALSDRLWGNFEEANEVFEQSREQTDAYTAGHYAKIRDRHLDIEPLYELCKHPAITDKLADILGPNLLMWRSEIFARPPKEEGKVDPPINWHQEGALQGFTMRPSVVPAEAATAWIAFDETMVSNGCVQIIPKTNRTHLFPMNPTPEEYGIFGRSRQIDCDPKEHDVVNMELKPGQFFLFSNWCIHGSLPNQSQNRRMGMVYRYANTSTRIYKKCYEPQLHPKVKEVGFLETDIWNEVKLPMEDLERDGHDLDLSNWFAVLARGVDDYGWNRVGVPKF